MFYKKMIKYIIGQSLNDLIGSVLQTMVKLLLKVSRR